MSLKDKQRIARLEANIARLADALGFVMQRLTNTVPSPIIGGEAKTYTMAELYQQQVQAQAIANKALTDAKAEQASITVQ